MARVCSALLAVHPREAFEQVRVQLNVARRQWSRVKFAAIPVDVHPHVAARATARAVGRESHRSAPLVHEALHGIVDRDWVEADPLDRSRAELLRFGWR